LPSQTEDSNHPSTLPPEELNPLINPLLAQNMGRWAEVYFTNLPENRDQAVAELLDQLRAQASAPGSAAPVSAPAPHEASAWQAADSMPRVLCPRCGYENRADHNFCGSCRTQLRGEVGAFPPFDSDPAHPGEMGEPAHGESPSSPLGNDNLEYDSFDYRETVPERPEMRTSPGPNSVDASGHDQISHDRLGDDRPSNDRPSADQRDYEVFRFSSVAEEPRRPYRVYAGVVIALVIVFLLYRAWSGEHASGEHAGAGISTAAPQLPPAAATDSSTPPTAVAPNSATSTASAPVNQPKAVTGSDEGTGETVSSKPSAQISASAPATSPALSPATYSATQAPTLAGSGAEELALAKSYLNGTDGKERNPAEAAALLWKAVAKQNAEATELLGDLYLKGDGVTKSCDQAHVLLDAAARKGRKDAAERLGHLEAFGCQ
jgi:hypothetical protein